MKLPVVVAAAALMVSPMLVSSAEAPPVPQKVTAMAPAMVTLRDGSGRAARFVDTRNREFAVRYDSKHRIEAVESTRSPNILDIVSIKYTDQGRLLAVSYRAGYSIFFDYRPNGTQVVRDTSGAGMVRSNQSYQSIDPASEELNTRLYESVGALETLLVALGRGS